MLRSSSLELERTFGAPELLLYPEGCCAHLDSLFVANCGHHVIDVFGLDGTHRARYGQRGTRPGEFESPCDVAVARGRLIVAEDRRIQVLSLHGDPQQLIDAAELARFNDSAHVHLLVGLCGLYVHGTQVLVTDGHARMLFVLSLPLVDMRAKEREARHQRTGASRGLPVYP